MIVITAPTGAIGSRVVRNLLAVGQDVRLIVRSAARLDDAIRGAVDLVEGSHGDPGVLDTALDGASALFWVVPPNPTASSVEEAYTGFSMPAIKAMADGKVGRVVGVSALGRGNPRAASAGNVTATLALDDRIEATGVDYRALTMPSFMDNIKRQVQLIKDRGIFTSPIPGDYAMPMCSTDDVAAVAARVLTDESWDGTGEVPILGPADLSFDNMAEIISDVLGKAVTFRQVSGQGFYERMTSIGMSGAMANALLDMAIAKADGLDQTVQRTPEASSPTTFREWCETDLKPSLAPR
ncbi:MAG: NAD(P)H-binding protein [Nocardioides sp.]